MTKLGVAVVGLTALALSGCQVQYVVNSAYYQAELMLARQPVEVVAATEVLSEEDHDALRLIDDVRAWGAAHGFADTENYQTIAWGWDRTIWVVSASPPLALEPASWWFPIVGRVPYLGYFTWDEAVTMRERLQDRGLDVAVREAGAYSTLGWFRDPILPSMLEWTRFHLVSTILHELAHATVWIPGDVGFNESFASFVGEEAAFDYLEDRYGPESDELREARDAHADWQRWRRLQVELCRDLEAIYGSEGSDAERLAAKEDAFASIPERIRAAGFHTPETYLAYAASATWNNGRMVQFLAYNDRRHLFERLLEDADGDLLVFMQRVRALTANASDPWAAITGNTGD